MASTTETDSSQLEAGKSKIKVLADLVCGEALLCLPVANFFTVSSHGGGWRKRKKIDRWIDRSISSSSYKATVLSY